MSVIASAIFQRRSLRACLALACGLLVLPVVFFPAPVASATIESLSVNPFYFSPARGDSATFSFSLADTASVFLFVFESDSSTVVDTLIAGQTRAGNRVHRVSWRGLYFDGTSAPEGAFLALLRADTGEEIDSTYSQLLFIDETPPQVFITLVDPGLIVPGSSDPAQSPDVEITCSVSDPPPGDSLEVDVVIYGPDGDLVDSLPERLVAANGVFKSTWEGENADDDGLHGVEVTVRDRALHSAKAKSYFDVDIGGPTITVISPESGEALRVLPDSLFGWAWDRSGTEDSIGVEYPGRESFLHVESTHASFDTLFFAIVLRDSIAEEGKLSFRFRAVDRVGQVRTKGYEITWDASPPAAPVLYSLPAVAHSPVVVLDGTVEGVSTDVMRIYRNDALVDTIFPKLEGRWPHTLDLTAGLNRIWAVMADNVGNVSPPSNTVEVTFDPSAGVHVPQPFRPGDSFQLNFAEIPRSVTVRIFDLGGHLVRVLEDRPASLYVTIPWDGTNGDGDEARKGPFVAVAYTELADGKNETHRRVFLFEP